VRARRVPDLESRIGDAGYPADRCIRIQRVIAMRNPMILVAELPFCFTVSNK